MTTITNAKIFLGGDYCDAIVKVPANTTYAEGTVLGRKSNGDLMAYSTDNDTALAVNFTAETATDGFVSEPTYILAQTLTNSTGSTVTYSNVRVFEGGPVDKSKIVFVKTADATNAVVLDKMKNNGFELRAVQQFN